MKNTLLLFIFFSIFTLNGYCQVEKTTTQVGISALPVFDVFKMRTGNKISGLAIAGNLGYFPRKNFSIGIQPFYAQASNSYINPISDKVKDNIKLYGLNTYLRYYFISKEKISIFSLASTGFGNSDQNTSSISFQNGKVTKRQTDTSVFTFVIGFGINYFITKNLAIELNASYIKLKYFSTDSDDTYFQTIEPTIGLQYYLK